ncbi:MAG: tetratricopeptide repeat protein [Alphaproteobacteria bacterium]
MTRLTLVVLVAAWSLAGCASLLPEAARQYRIATEAITASEPEVPNDQRLADLGYAAIAAGNLTLAETHLNSALAINPHNPYALLNLGVVYQSTGRAAEAQALYRKVIALNPAATAITATRENHIGLGLVEIAHNNLAGLETALAEKPPPPPGPEDVERATLERFAALAQLREAGLITPAEYEARRQANLGALLPLTGPPASPLVGLPAPRVDHLVKRLGAIAQFRDAGALTPAEYALERTAILDGLLPLRPGDALHTPSAPAVSPDPQPALARLDRLRAANFITDTERQRERAERLARTRTVAETQAGATEDGAGTTAEAAAEPAAPPAATAEPPPAPSVTRAGATPHIRRRITTTQPAAAPPAEKALPAPTAGDSATGGEKPVGVHVSSFRTPERARRAWDELHAAYGDVLAGLGPRIARVDLGREKGVFYQLHLGPVRDQASAQALCSELKRRSLYCAPTVF